MSYIFRHEELEVIFALQIDILATFCYQNYKTVALPLARNYVANLV